VQVSPGFVGFPSAFAWGFSQSIGISLDFACEASSFPLVSFASAGGGVQASLGFARLTSAFACVSLGFAWFRSVSLDFASVSDWLRLLSLLLALAFLD